MAPNRPIGTREVVLRGYKPGDLGACRELWAELTEWHRQLYDSPSIGGTDPGRHFDAHLASVGRAHIWVADIDGEVVGLSGLILGDVYAELEPLTVRASYRQKGIGRRLAAAVIDPARLQGAKKLKDRYRSHPTMRPPDVPKALNLGVRGSAPATIVSSGFNCLLTGAWLAVSNRGPSTTDSLSEAYPRKLQETQY